MVAPKRDTTYSVIADVARSAIVHKAYDGVKFTGYTLITDGSSDLDNLEFEETDMDSSSEPLIRPFLLAKDLEFDTLIIRGFSTVPRGLYMTGSSRGGLTVRKFISRNGPGGVDSDLFRTTSAVDRVYLMGYDVEGNHGSDTGSAAIRISGAIDGSLRRYLGPGTATGYQSAVVYNRFVYPVDGPQNRDARIQNSALNENTTLGLTHRFLSWQNTSTNSHTYTIPTDAASGFTSGDWLRLMRTSTGTTTILPDTGVTLYWEGQDFNGSGSAGTLLLDAPGSSGMSIVELYHHSTTNVWVARGSGLSTPP
jgi:hypothetical protein